MTTTNIASFTSAASNAIDQYSKIGKFVVGAWRDGAQKFFNGANERYATYLNSDALSMIDNNVKTTLIGAQTKIAGLIEGGIKTGTGQAEQAIDMLVGGLNGGIQRVAETTGKVESAFKTAATEVEAEVQRVVKKATRRTAVGA